MDIKLQATTAVEHCDVLLRELIALFETSFPARVCSYYLGGSFSDGTAVGHDRSANSSDVDLFVIFRGAMTEVESVTFQRLVAECRASSPIQVDAHAYSEDDLLRRPRPDATQISFLSALIREASVLVYGDDLRADLPPVQSSLYTLDVIESGVFHLGIPRQRESLAYPLVTPLVFPLTYPDLTGEFYGYDVVPARPGAPRGTRVLVALATWIATFILAVETGHFAGQKSQCLRLCQEYLPNDQRTQLATAMYAFCKGVWGYALPDSAKDRAQLRGFCHDTLALENEYLRLCHDLLLSHLQRGGEQERRQAERILQSITF